MPRLLALLILLIVYGSTYPWRFAPPRGGPGAAIRYLFSGFGILFMPDVLVNIVFYVPVGACAYLAFRPRLHPLAAGLAAVALGGVLSLGIEIVQAFEVTRRTSIYDVYANTAGSVVGAAVAAIFTGISGFLHHRRTSERHDRGALALIVCWAAYWLFPFVPLLSTLGMPARLEHARAFAVFPFASAAVGWYVIGNAIRAAGVRRARLVCALSVLIIPAQLLIHRRQPTIADLAGAMLGVTLFATTRNHETARKAAVWATMVLLIVTGLLPLRFASQQHSFNWVPFAALLDTNWRDGSQILIGKLFLYTAAIWSLRNIGVRLRTAALSTAAVLLFIEASQVWMQRTPEITDPLLALMIGVGLDAFYSEPRRTSSLSGTSA